MIRYDRLWNTMEVQGITQYRLIKQHNFSAGQIGRLKKNMHVSTHTLDTLCTLLECGVSDIIEYIPDGQPQTEEPAPADAPEGQESPDPSSRSKKTDSVKADKPKKAGKSKKGDKKAAKDSKESKESKKSKEGKKSK